MLDTLMFWIHQILTMWHVLRMYILLFRIGCFWFWVWKMYLGILGSIMVLPMGIAMEQLDDSLCKFRPDTSLGQYFYR